MAALYFAKTLQKVRHRPGNQKCEPARALQSLRAPVASMSGASPAHGASGKAHLGATILSPVRSSLARFVLLTERPVGRSLAVRVDGSGGIFPAPCAAKGR